MRCPNGVSSLSLPSQIVGSSPRLSYTFLSSPFLFPRRSLCFD